MKGSNCIVIGGDHHNTLGVIRALGQKEIKSTLIIVPNEGISFVSKSKYVDDFIQFKDEEDVIPYLLKRKVTSFGKDTIICCSDLTASLIDHNYDLLKDNYYCPHSIYGADYLTKVMDKNVMLEMAEINGLPVPKSWNNIADVEFPCFIKPLVSKSGSKSDIRKCSNLEEFKTYLNECHVSDSFQIQDYIDKDFEFQLIGLSLNGGEKIIIPGVSKILRSSNTSNTGYLSYQPLCSINFKFLDECKKFIKQIGLCGLFSIEFIRDKNGNDYFMEINLRNDGNAICVTSSGVNLPYLWHGSQYTEIIDDNISVNTYKRTLPEFDDFFLFRQHKISFMQWLKSIKEADSYMEFDKHDIRPFLYRILQLVISKLPK